MLKTLGPDGTARVEFTLDAAVGADTAAVCGEWNDWAQAADPMARRGDGSFSLALDLPVGRRYRFRYLLDGNRWENDWEADAYIPNDFGGDDSVVDLTAVATKTATKAPTRRAPARKATTKAPTTGKTATGKTATSKTATSKTATGKTATGKTATGKTATGKTATGKTATGKTATSKTATSKTATRRSPQGTE